MLSEKENQVLNHLARYITEHKKNFIESVLDLRTRHITVVLEDIYQSQNSSAVIRTCECLGIQDVHVIENRAIYTVNRKVLKGSHKWITLLRYRHREDRTLECFHALRNRGYRIIATSPAGSGTTVDDLDVTVPVALVFGNELRGLSDTALQHCDGQIRIPMYGFTESLNISVSVALCLFQLIRKVQVNGVSFHLSPEQRDELRLSWYRSIVRRSEIIEREFLRTIA
ncbi:MAG TPA: RNA methyltransferase [Cyclobacteriaceae bacterium]